MIYELLRKMWMVNLVGVLLHLGICVSTKVEAQYESCARKIDALLPVLGCALLLAFTPVDAAQAAETALIEFSLESHDRQTYTDKSWDNKLLVLFLSSREGAEYNQQHAWSRPIADFISSRAAPGEFALVRIAEVPKIPRLFRGMVRDAVTPVAGDPLSLSLIDWNGEFYRRYELQQDAYNLLVFDKSGQLVLNAALKKFEESRLAEIFMSLEALGL